MKIKKYIEPKRQYTPPRIYVKALLMEGKLLAGTYVTGKDFDDDDDDDDEKGNLKSKRMFFLENDEIE